MHGLQLFDATSNLVFSSDQPVMRKALTFSVSDNDGTDSSPIIPGIRIIDSIITPYGYNIRDVGIMMRPIVGQYFGPIVKEFSGFSEDFQSIKYETPQVSFWVHNGGSQEIILFSKSGVSDTNTGTFGAKMYQDGSVTISESDKLFFFDAIYTYVNPSSLFMSFASANTYLTTLTLPQTPAGHKRYFFIKSNSFRSATNDDVTIVAKLLNENTLEVYSQSANRNSWSAVPILTHYIYTGYCLE